MRKIRNMKIHALNITRITFIRGQNLIIYVLGKGLKIRSINISFLEVSLTFLLIKFNSIQKFATPCN